MKVGMVLECTKGGPDAKIYPYVLQRLCPAMQVVPPETMGNKKNLIDLGPEAAKILIEKEGCDLVLMIWDRMPKWGGTGRCAEMELALQGRLAQLGVNMSRVVQCCIDEMLESWIVADGRGVTAFLSTQNSHLGEFKDAPPSNPKERLKKYYAGYNDFLHDLGIVQAMPDFDRAARKNASFGRFCAAIHKACP
jgi:hypothetical protein